tara:strand:- start:1046 stop:1267 length:222 start_codon:yes stop_codon:yes gene_type:complete
MKAVSLSPRIKYFHCDGGDEGPHGVLVLLGSNGRPTKASDISDQADFRFWFKNFKIAEDMMAELYPAAKAVTA